MSGWLTIVGGFGLWIVIELAGTALAPVFRPIGRAIGRMTNRWTVGLLWMGALASYAFVPYASNAVSPVVGTLGFVAVMGLTPLALMGTFALRGRRRAARAELARIAAAQPRPEPVWHPAARVHRR
ncbi:MAG TPA: hypothetical protein VFT45_22735 [Longimicrobium sp.]|nr:hypothetical protein [Longimicrobium sp.]